jgi:hypothetical protein
MLQSAFCNKSVDFVFQTKALFDADAYTAYKYYSIIKAHPVQPGQALRVPGG